jgi:hypothetical protein
MKPGDQVITPDGPGRIEILEFFKYARRYGIILDGGYQIVYYFDKEINEVRK